MSEDLDLARGAHAHRLLNDPLLKESFDLVAIGLHQAWEAAPIRDQEGQHELKLMLKLLNDVRSNLAQVLEAGKLTQITIKGREKLSPPQWRREYYGY